MSIPGMTSGGAGVAAGSSFASTLYSLRFTRATPTYLSATYTTATAFTFSCWVKRGVLGVQQSILEGALQFNSSGTITAFGLTTTAVYRDPSAWLHIVVSDNLYVNGVNMGSVTTTARTNSRIGYDGSNAFDGYIAQLVLIDGTKYAASAFAATDPATGIWAPLSNSSIRANVNFGTKGFFLMFNDPTSATGTESVPPTLGYDRQVSDSDTSKNNWILNNFNTYDQVLDNPTNNFAVLNPLVPTGGGPTLSSGNLRYTTIAGSTGATVLSMLIPSSGKWYWEISRIDTIAGNGAPAVGVVRSDVNPATTGTTANTWYWAAGATKYTEGPGTSYGNTWTDSTGTNVIGVAFDTDSGNLTFYLNGSSQGVAFTGLTSINRYYPALSDVGSSNSWTAVINAGQGGQGGPIELNFDSASGGRFKYTPPSGYKALCSANLPTVTITTSGSFTGNANADGPFVYLGGVPTAMTIDGNAVTFGTHVDKLSNGFKVRTASSPYNDAATNTYTITTTGAKVTAPSNAQGNP